MEQEEVYYCELCGVRTNHFYRFCSEKCEFDAQQAINKETE
jgi:endogenous inhibitor of DNA gyrase (YacG/DUF329 family)